MNKAALLRTALADKDVVRIVGAHNGVGARLAEKHGFDGVWASGLEVSTSHALPDANILTMTEYLAAAEEMNDACGLPVVADCDTGYGNSNNVMHMVRKYEAAGIAAVCIEDKKFPKVNSYVPGRQELAPVGEFVGKIMAAKGAQRSSDFVVVARVEALIAGWGQDEALRRADAYAAAGADMILMHSKADSDSEVREFLSRWKARLPVVIVPTTYPDIDLSDLAGLGVKVVIYANHGLRASIRAMDDVFSRIASEDGIAGLTEEDIVPMSTVFGLQGMTEMREAEKEYQCRDRVVILAAGEPNDDSMRAVLADRPLAMVDINGKSLLQRNAETMNICGIQEVVVAVGYEAANVSLEGAGTIVNRDFRTKGSASSLLQAEVGPAERTLVLYGDVLVDRHLIRRLLEAAGDVVIVVDDSYKMAGDARNIDHVIIEMQQATGSRKIDGGAPSRVAAIGSGVTADRATHEFVGVALFSQHALEAMHAGAKEEPGLADGAVPDLLAAMMARGMEIGAVVVNSGWKEIHTFEHYREACALLR